MKQFINPVYSHQGANQLVYLHRFGTCAIRYSWAQIAHVQGQYQWWTRIRQSVSYAYDQHCFDIVGGDGYVTDVPRLASSQTGLSFPFQILTAPIRSPAWLIRAMCWTGGWSRIWIHPVICINLLHFFLNCRIAGYKWNIFWRNVADISRTMGCCDHNTMGTQGLCWFGAGSRRHTASFVGFPDAWNSPDWTDKRENPWVAIEQ